MIVKKHKLGMILHQFGVEIHAIILTFVTQ